MSYDPQARRDTPLALKLKARIRREGALSVAEYVRACLHDPEHGYYRRMPAIGADGDFITAPEISQVFGELIGLWSAVVWQQMGSPQVVHLVELGPGRGSMMRDALRAAKLAPGFLQASRVHLVDSSAHLRDVQSQTLSVAGVPIQWHRELATAVGKDGSIPPGPTIVLANEYLDAQQVGQYVYRDGAWRERRVSLDEYDRLAFSEGSPDPDFVSRAGRGDPAKDGDIEERCSDLDYVGNVLTDLAARMPTAGLFIDYGHTEPRIGETLQAVCSHQAVSPLFAPGESDLTAHVDFAAFAQSCKHSGIAETDGPVTQAEFLGSLGIVERASRLMAANPARAGEIETGIARLIAPGAMGTRFKAIGIRSAGLPPLPGLSPR